MPQKIAITLIITLLYAFSYWAGRQVRDSHPARTQTVTIPAPAPAPTGQPA